MTRGDSPQSKGQSQSQSQSQGQAGPGPEDDLDEVDDFDEPWTLGPQLAQLLASSDELDRDVSSQVDRRLRGRSAITDVVDLLSLGWSTMRLLLIEDTTTADSEGEGH